jgi:hypothetical protein
MAIIAKEKRYTLVLLLSKLVIWDLYFLQNSQSEPKFVNLLKSPGIDSQPGGPVRQPYLTSGFRLHRLEESIPGLF